MRLLGISGSLRAGSWNSALLRAAAEVPPPGTELRVYNGLRSIPPFDEDEEAVAPPAVGQWRRELLDWASRPLSESVLTRKPVAVIGASTGLFGAQWAQEELRRTLARCGAVVLEASFALAEAARRFDRRGRLVADDDRAALARVVAGLLESAS